MWVLLALASDSQATAIYEAGYWKPSGAGNISDKQMSWLYFDTYMHGGGASVLKRTTSPLGMNNSINGLNKSLDKYGAANIFYNYKCERLCRFDRLIEARPRLGKFKNGWYNRVNKFQYQN
jgi:lysozyme family protein